METILWAANLVAVIYLCLWALRQDKADQPRNGKRED